MKAPMEENEIEKKREILCVYEKESVCVREKERKKERKKERNKEPM